MKRTRFSEEQIIVILKEQEACLKMADLCRKHWIELAPDVEPAGLVNYGFI